MTPTLHVDATGMCCALGLTTDSASAAMRAGLDHFRLTDFLDFTDAPIVGGLLDNLPFGDVVLRASELFNMGIAECLTGITPEKLKKIPLLLITAEDTRPGLPDAWAQHVFAACTTGYVFHQESRICPWGKAGLGAVLPYAHQLLTTTDITQVLVAGVDTYFDLPVLTNLLQNRRLITRYNSDGFHPAEGAGAILLSLGTQEQKGLHILGVGYAEEAAHRLQTDHPNRSVGMTTAINMAVTESGHPLTDTYFHYSDCSGESFYFKEATYALIRCLEHTIPSYPHFITGSTLGETGASIGPLLVAHCTRLLSRDDSIGNRALLHFSSDNGKRSAVIVEYRSYNIEV